MGLPRPRCGLSVATRPQRGRGNPISVPAWDYHDLVAAWWPPTGFYAEFWKLSGNKAISLSVYALRMIVDTDAKRSSCGMKDCAPHGSATRARSCAIKIHQAIE